MPEVLTSLENPNLPEATNLGDQVKRILGQRILNSCSDMIDRRLHDIELNAGFLHLVRLVRSFSFVGEFVDTGSLTNTLLQPLNATSSRGAIAGGRLYSHM